MGSRYSYLGLHVCTVGTLLTDPSPPDKCKNTVYLENGQEHKLPLSGKSLNNYLARFPLCA